MQDNAQKKLLVVQVAGLGHELLRRHHGESLLDLPLRSLEAVFPALTCTVQASFRTASYPVSHGMIANGLYDRRYRRTLFWEQSSALVQGDRIWKRFREAGRTVGMLFWQQSLGEDADVVLSPAPIHKHHGGMIQDCYARPPALYQQLCHRLGRRFNLAHYWGPMACPRSSSWIADATCAVISDPDLAPDLCLTYLPALDYDLQRSGPASPRSLKALDEVIDQLRALHAAACAAGYELLVFGDYAIGPCDHGAVFPNRALAEAGLLAERRVGGMVYPDLHASRAFAMVDHEIAHVYLRGKGSAEAARAALANLPGVGEVMGQVDQESARVRHANGGELLLVARPGYWFAYPWWVASREAPDYAGHVDIHSKPGYDPCELFFGWPPGSVSGNTRRVSGTHGRVGHGREVAWCSTVIEGEMKDTVELAKAVGQWLGE